MKRTKKMNLPKQVAPVQRPSLSTAVFNQNGVEASGMFDLLKMQKYL